MAPREADMSRLRSRGLWLEYASMAWMTAEAGVAITSGIIASSIALIGFGLDSVIEFFAAAVVVWQLHGGVSEVRETRARASSAAPSSRWPPTSPSRASPTWPASTGPRNPPQASR